MSTSKMTISDRYFSNSNMTRLRKVMSVISIVLFMSSVMLVAVKGFNWGLDFTGGVVAEVQLSDQVTKDVLKTKLDTAFQQDVQVVGMAEQDRWTIRYSQLTDAPQPNLVDALSSVSDQVKVLNSSVVGPQVGQDMVDQGGLAVLVCFLMIMLYLSVRFEWRLAAGAVMALTHDVIITLGIFSLLQIEVDLTIVAALLPDGRLGEEYTYQLQTIGQSPTSSVTFTSPGPLPDGILLSPGGRLVGIISRRDVLRAFQELW